ncbi:MAG: zinc ABC transporter substrate-binding protein [Methanoregulaceae archaeon]|jgi:zinc transport system substrate-binding protein|nr:zinc ABC transporter substrate-binding protein [Methanoregulaceae archaeon]
MQNRFTPSLVAAVALLFALLLIAPGCISLDGDDTKKEIRVAVTIPPQEEMVREIGGEHVEIFVMVPPGSDPHTYEPLPALVAKAAEADMYLTLGTGLLPVEDVLASRLEAMNPDLVIVDSSRGITYLRNHEETEDWSSGMETGESPDPHIWLSLRNAEIMSVNTCDALIIADPAHEKEYRENCDRYTTRLKELDQRISDAFSGNTPGIILVTHPAWAYFARDYDLEMVAIEHEGKEPTAKELEALIVLGRTHGIRVVFAEAQESTREAETIAREIGGTVRVIDPLAGDYLANMERVSHAFMETGAG